MVVVERSLTNAKDNVSSQIWRVFWLAEACLTPLGGGRWSIVALKIDFQGQSLASYP
jgi:hypothetical protein